MKCQLISDELGSNPLYDRNAHIQALENGEPYDQTPSIKRPAGTLIEDPKAWVHCLPGHMNRPAKAVPADDACRAKYVAEMKKRPAKVSTLDKILDVKPATESAELNAQMLRFAYAEELNELNATKYPMPTESDLEAFDERLKAAREVSVELPNLNLNQPETDPDD